MEDGSSPEKRSRISPRRSLARQAGIGAASPLHRTKTEAQSHLRHREDLSGAEGRISMTVGPGTQHLEVAPGAVGPASGRGAGSAAMLILSSSNPGTFKLP